MSYANVAAHDAPPSSLQPHADQSLLNTTPPSAGSAADDGAKVNVVRNDFKQHPVTYTSQADFIVDDEEFPEPGKKKRPNKRVKEVEAEGAYLWNIAKQYLFRPGVAGGLIGIVNIGLLAGAGRAFYAQPHLRRDTKVISSTIAGALALLSVEGYAAEKYAQTPRGHAEAQRAKKEGSLIYKHLHEQVLRPGVLGGLVGLVNAGILGTVGYFGYINWDKPTWDRRTVSAVSVGLLTLWGGEGFLAERYRKDHH
ncbi:hypothetical protein PLICRDRAFT_467215 [Plicaturopsis crispa FD-325 SS-3]|nr:hypothetical protein PLICRDRAFT_467215 [Plicaturopsis crispa FD-325 SS-3]